MVEELTNGEFEEFIKEGTVLIDFFADWCMPCVMMSPIIDEMAEKFDGKIKIAKVNIEDDEESAKKFDVKSIPNMVLFKDGEIVDRYIGALGAEELEENLKKHL